MAARREWRDVIMREKYRRRIRLFNRPLYEIKMFP
jgi:hypothetical protein